MDIAVSPTFSLWALIGLLFFTLTAIPTIYWHRPSTGLKTDKVSPVKRWALGCGCATQSALLVLSIVHYSKLINSGDGLWLALNLLLRFSHRCAIALEYFQTQRWLEYAPYTFTLVSLAILPPRTLRGTSSSFSFFRNDVDFETTFAIILLEVFLLSGFSCTSYDFLTFKYMVIVLAATACMIAGQHDASVQDEVFMIFPLAIYFMRLLYWCAYPSSQPTYEVKQKSLELHSPVGGESTKSANVDLENLPHSREPQPSPSNPSDSLGRDDIGQRQQAAFYVPPSSKISMEAELVEDLTMAGLECPTKLEWQKIMENRRELERQKIHRGERVRRI